MTNRKEDFAKSTFVVYDGGVPVQSTRVENLAMLRAFLHPLRIELLAALRVDGPATASELARRLGESSGATSYHLRQLARYGYVVDDDEQPSGRERRWRAAQPLTSFQVADFIDDPAGRSTLRLLEQERVRRLTGNLERWFEARTTWPRPWVDAAEESDVRLRLRPDDLTRMMAEIWDVITPYLDDQAPPGDAEAAPVVMHLYAVPDVEAAARGASS